MATRQAWIAASISRWDAPVHLGWRREEFSRAAKARGLQMGRLDRYTSADLDALAADEDLAAQVLADRLPHTWRSARPTSGTCWPPT